ncbi:MAG: ArsA-related P-loop ATPase [Acidimicrobiia bacterium]
MLERRLLIVTGKGGAGRSALSAAAAIHAAKHGRQVLAIGMTDATGLGSHLRVPILGTQPALVRPGLHALAVDPAAALDEYLRLRLKVPRFGPATRAFRVLAETVPGIRDTVVMGKILFEATRDRWDLVVADAPPTGQVMSYLRAPATIESLVPRGRVKEQASWMRMTLHDPGVTGLMITATPEELPVAETKETLAALAAEGLIEGTAVVANRVLPPLNIPEERIGREPAGSRRDAATLHLELEAAQRVHLDRLKPDMRFPLLFGLRTPGEVASRLSELWGNQ